jgi:hypothetical protein
LPLSSGSVKCGRIIKRLTRVSAFCGTDKIVPSMVGVDIGCGMETVKPVERIRPTYNFKASE